MYENLRDRLFGAPGTWSFRSCPNPQCALLWLDPAPLEQDIALAYRNYYTHAPPPASTGPLRRAYRLLLPLTPLLRQRQRLRAMCLDTVKPGRVLEVGCGAGQRLAALRKIGWQAEGQEIDPQAAALARQMHGLQVHLGPLEQLALPEESFDAVVMNHVIEHVHDPARLVAECRRLLKPGGRFVAVTPNAGSFLHKRFGSSWRGLEPPRHLHIFSPRTLPQLAERAGLARARCWTSAANAFSFALGSLLIQRRSAHAAAARPGLAIQLRALALQLREHAALAGNPAIGEECVLEATK